MIEKWAGKKKKKEREKKYFKQEKCCPCHYSMKWHHGDRRWVTRTWVVALIWVLCWKKHLRGCRLEKRGDLPCMGGELGWPLLANC